ncbi:MAG TPA: hypothetical protein VGI06_01335 [Acidimicrobiales bacterium]
MSVDPRTPVLVGAGTASQRFEDPASGLEAAALMAAACAEAGSPGLLRTAGLILVPRGTWRYHDAGRLVGALVGNTTARTVLAELGVLQTSLIERACSLIAAGDVDVALVVGGEAKWRDLRQTITGRPAPSTDDTGAEPDEVMRRESDVVDPAEVAAGLGGYSAVNHYAVIENARRWADGQSLEEHQATVAGLWEGFSAVAAANPEAWHRTPMAASDIRTPGPANKPLAWPYNKWHTSQWNVDQAACLILCSAEAARAHGVPADQWVFPHAIAWSDHMVPVSHRRAIHRSPGFRLAGRAAFGLVGAGPDDIAHADLYSCFPIAVRTQALELGLGADRALTVTGGMTFAGGPLNNYVLQSTARMASVLRRDPDALGLVTAVSGMLTKQGVSIWGCRPPAVGFRSADVTAADAESTGRVPLVTEATAATTATDAAGPPTPAGPATVAGYTVVAGGDAPDRAVVVVDLGDDRRALASSTDPGLTAAMREEEWCGRSVVLDGGGGFS